MQANALYCTRIMTPHLYSIESGVEAIETILSKAVLCRHDVKKINKIYRKIEHLEKQSKEIPNINSHRALEKIVGKIKKIAAEKNIFGLVSLYHLQDFLDKDLHLAKHFSQMWSQVEKNPQLHKQMAAYLSCCHSGLKRGKPQSYPPYYRELLENGYIHLYDHLIHMRSFTDRITRSAEIKKISFSLLSHIILETREAIIQKVKNSIPNGASNVLFLIGGTGAGKSTTLCFLKKHVMTLENFCYQSASDQSGLIGDDIATSCTFLPTIEKTNDWFLVDFPGFEDTNGFLISLGIEFALKALIAAYNPKVLVLESITNKEAATKLGQHLKRLFKNTEDCLLGITKYTKDPDFIEIKNIEEDQRKKLAKPSPKEFELIQAGRVASQKALELEGALEYASEDDLAEDAIKEMEEELAEWRQKKKEIELELAKLQEMRKSFSEKDSPLLEIPKKTERKNKIREKEDTLAEQMGIKKIFRFDNLQDHNLVNSCFQTLTELKTIRPFFENQLDAEEERFLKDCFRKDLKKQIKSNSEFQLNFQNFDAFNNSVLETSFISTMYSQSNPEIGKLFHLPEMDLRIVQGYDKKIVGDCIQKIIELVIRTFDATLIKEILKEIEGKTSQKNIEEFQKKLNRLQDYIIILLKGERPTSKADTEEIWASLREEYRMEIKKIEYSAVSNVVNIVSDAINNDIIYWALFSHIPSWGVLAVYAIKLYYWVETHKEKITNELITSHSNNLDELYEFLLRLKELEKIVVKKDQMNEAFHSVEIATNSIEDLYESIKNKIHQVRDIYGGPDWDRRIEFLKKDFHRDSWINKLSCYPLCAYLLIEPGLSYEIEMHESRRSNSLKKISFVIDRESTLSNTYQVHHGLDSIAEELGFIYDENKMVKGRIEIKTKLKENEYFELPKHWVELFNEPLLVNRALYADALLKANHANK